MSVTIVATAGGTAFASCSTPGRSSDRSPSAQDPAGTTDSPAAKATVDRLELRASDDPSLPPYRRDAFGSDWSYDPETGCNTRERVLIEESLVEPTLDDRCHPLSGRWRSSYDGITTTDPDDLQIDHVIALADAWRSGAADWTDARRFAFANDLSDPAVLVAVTGASNQSKGDSTPDEWLPPDRDAWCGYAGSWVEVKSRWGLSVTPAEKSALVQVLSGC